MRRTWILVPSRFISLFVLLLGWAHTAVPQSSPREPAGCGSTAPANELPMARFKRLGGHTTRVKTRYQDGTFTTDDVAQGRDLSRYERLDLVDKRRFVADTGGQPLLAQARSFLWSHWQDRKRAYLVLTLSSVDFTTTSHVFIEPGQLGDLLMHWRSVRQDNTVDDQPAVHLMQWVIPNGWDKPGVPLSQGARPDPAKDELEFRDTCGRVSGGL